MPDGQRGAEPVITVLFIAGVGRSGTTLLDCLLGGTSEAHSGGEIGGIWQHGLVDDRLCSCGASFSECSFWRAVTDKSFSTLKTNEISAIITYLDRALPVWAVWRLLSHRMRDRLVQSAPGSFFELTERLYQGLLEVSDRPVLVDASKVPAYLLLLAQLSSLDLRVIHLVRDPRAVMHSWRRHLVLDPDGRSSMPRFGVAKSALLWLIMNLAVEWTARQLALPYVRVHYEDLVQDPYGTLRRIQVEFGIANAGSGSTKVDSLDLKEVDFGTMHTISGNPTRFQRGRRPIAEDNAWRDDPKLWRAIVTTITLPSRWRYGY